MMQFAERLDATLVPDCIRSVSRFGRTTYVNICNGQSVDVPWGEMTFFWVVTFAVTMVLTAVWSYRVMTR